MHIQISPKEETLISEARALLEREGECYFFFAPNKAEIKRQTDDRLLVQILGGELQRNATILAEEHVRALLRWERLTLFRECDRFDELAAKAIVDQYWVETIDTSRFMSYDDLVIVFSDALFDKIHF